MTSRPGRPGAGAILAVLLIGLLWGLNWPAVKFMLTEIPPITIRAVAFPLATVVLAAIARARGERLRPAPGEIAPIVITGLLMVGSFNVAVAVGQTLTETSKAAIIAYTMPALTAGFAVIFLRERVDFRLVAALAIGMGGLAVLASEDFVGLVRNPAGPAIMLLGALSWALGNIALKARRWSLTPLALTVWYFGVSAAACWSLVLIFEPPWRQTWPGGPVLWTMFWHVLGPMVVGYALWTALLDRLPATVAAISTLTAPVVGVLSSILLLGDPPSWQKAVALTMVVASILITLIRSPKRAK
ncbi:DMT family transporter [Pikeienuella piscinae]|uniref:DMT family transporter n=1 Tax=Pikeienuella piscinae TaxID=2748098 RepID=A0A7L5BVM6_9RHOB|nr:DMT family transporter [Pikeienuella piscinae]QIE54557.1 DMT family transporter [Pikeienuella piscinae]